MKHEPNKSNLQSKPTWKSARHCLHLNPRQQRPVLAAQARAKDKRPDRRSLDVVLFASDMGWPVHGTGRLPGAEREPGE